MSLEPTKLQLLLALRFCQLHFYLLKYLLAHSMAIDNVFDLIGYPLKLRKNVGSGGVWRRKKQSILVGPRCQRPTLPVAYIHIWGEKSTSLSNWELTIKFRIFCIFLLVWRSLNEIFSGFHISLCLSSHSGTPPIKHSCHHKPTLPQQQQWSFLLKI